MVVIEHAQAAHIDGLVDLGSALFAEDAGRHDTFVDTTWPQREGRADFERLVSDTSSIVLVAHDDGYVVGFLDGYRTGSSPTRQPVDYAILRSMYVRSQHRRTGVGAGLTERFFVWAKESGCVEAHVDSYIANSPAQQFYERHGFVSRSISRVLAL